MVPPRSKKHGCGRRGTTLVEVVVSTLLIGMMTAMCMPVFLTGRMSVGRADRRAAAADAVHGVAEALKGYVTADLSLANGPGTGFDGWSLPGDLSGRRALESGDHALDSAMWAAPLASYGGVLSYSVAIRATPSGPQPDVSFRVSWVEP